MTATDTNIFELTYKIANELLVANFETGVLTWKTRERKWFKSDGDYKIWNKRFSEKRAGTMLKTSGKSYYSIFILSNQYLIHRILFLLHEKRWPIDQIDHIDGNGINNCWDNLREVTHKVNHQNVKLQSNNTSGVCGVYWHKVANKWTASITVNKNTQHLGLFNDFFEACCVRKSEENKHGFHKNHGSSRPL